MMNLKQKIQTLATMSQVMFLGQLTNAPRVGNMDVVNAMSGHPTIN